MEPFIGNLHSFPSTALLQLAVPQSMTLEGPWVSILIRTHCATEVPLDPKTLNPVLKTAGDVIEKPNGLYSCLFLRLHVLSVLL